MILDSLNYAHFMLQNMICGTCSINVLFEVQEDMVDVDPKY